MKGHLQGGVSLGIRLLEHHMNQVTITLFKDVRALQRRLGSRGPWPGGWASSVALESVGFRLCNFLVLVELCAFICKFLRPTLHSGWHNKAILLRSFWHFAQCTVADWDLWLRLPAY